MAMDQADTGGLDAAWMADWTTIVQSELAAWAVDPEMHEGLAAMALLMREAGRGQGIDGDDRQGTSPAGSGEQAGAAAAGDASVVGCGAAAGLQARIAELERRVAELERKPARRRQRATAACG